jgi:hypothetical protein
MLLVVGRMDGRVDENEIVRERVVVVMVESEMLPASSLMKRDGLVSAAPSEVLSEGRKGGVGVAGR